MPCTIQSHSIQLAVINENVAKQMTDRLKRNSDVSSANKLHCSATKRCHCIVHSFITLAKCFPIFKKKFFHCCIYGRPLAWARGGTCVVWWGRIYSMGKQIRVLGTKVSQRDPRGALRMPPEADDDRL